jgi:hypothetical protein
MWRRDFSPAAENGAVTEVVPYASSVAFPNVACVVVGSMI